MSVSRKTVTYRLAYARVRTDETKRNGWAVALLCAALLLAPAAMAWGAESGPAADAAAAPLLVTAVASSVPTTSPQDITHATPPEIPSASESPTGLQLEVVGRRLPPEASEDRSAASTTIAREQLEAPAVALADVLDQAPGMRTTAAGSLGSFSSIHIRGASSQQTQVYLDGVRLNRAATGLVDMGALPVANIESVDVYRGAAPLSLGGSAIGGAVSIRTRRPSASELWVSADGGSFGAMGGAASFAGSVSGVAIDAAVAARRSDGDFSYRDDRATAFDESDDRIVTRRNNEAEQFDTLLRLRTNLAPDWTLSVTELLYGLSGGLAGSAIHQAAEASHRQWRSLTALAADIRDVPAAGWDLAAQLDVLALGQNLHDPLGEIGLTPQDSASRTYAPAGTLTIQGEIASWLRLGVMGSVEAEWFELSDRGRASAVPARSERVSVAGAFQPQIEIRAADMTVIPTIRIEHIRSDAPDIGRFGLVSVGRGDEVDDLASWRLGAVYRPLAWLSVKGNVARAFRVPSFYEMFGDGAYVVGNPMLRPELATVADLGATVRYGFGAGRDFVLAEVFAYRTEIADAIQFARSTINTVRALNLDSATLQGVEAGLHADMLGALGLRASYTLLLSEQHSAAPSRDGNVLPLRPETRWFARPEAYLPLHGAVSRLAVHAEAEYQSGNFADHANLAVIPPRWLLGAGADIEAFDGDLALSFVGRNLTDNRINDLIGFPLPGRSFYAGIRYRIF